MLLHNSACPFETIWLEETTMTVAKRKKFLTVLRLTTVKYWTVVRVNDIENLKEWDVQKTSIYELNIAPEK